jgi:hypothetical protein
MALSINGTVTTVIAVAIGLIMIGSLLAPVAQDVMNDLTHETGGKADYTEGATWASLVGVLVLFAIIGLLIVAVNGYTNGKK